MSDFELLELAAKAIGEKVSREASEIMAGVEGVYLEGIQKPWSPLTDDGDALRLAVKTKLHIGLESHTVSAWANDCFGNFQTENFIARDENDATRRAIVRAAAAIGKKRGAA